MKIAFPYGRRITLREEQLCAQNMERSGRKELKMSEARIITAPLEEMRVVVQEKRCEL